MKLYLTIIICLIYISTSAQTAGEIGFGVSCKKSNESCDDNLPLIKNCTSGNCLLNNLSYNWEKSDNNINFTNVTGTGVNVDYQTVIGDFGPSFPSIIYFRRVTICTDKNNKSTINYSNTVTVTINPTPKPQITSVDDYCIGRKYTVTVSPENNISNTCTFNVSSNLNYTGTNPSYEVSASTIGTGTLTYTVTNNYGCTATATKSISITHIDPIIVYTTECSGNPITAKITITQPDKDYEYKLDGGSYQGSNVFTGVSIGNHKIYLKDKDGCISKEKTINISCNCEPPTVNITTDPSNTTICEGSSIKITASTVPIGSSYTYKWSNNATTQSIDVMPNINTTYSVTVTKDNVSTCTGTASIDIKVNKKPNPGTLSGGNSLCVGDSLMILSNGDNNGNWSSSQPTIATIDNYGKVKGISKGTSIITYTVSNSPCKDSSSTINFTVNANPTIGGAKSVCVGSMAKVTPNSGGTWTSNDNMIATVTNEGVVTGVGSGTVELTFTENTTSCSNKVSFKVNANPTIEGEISVCVGSMAKVTPNSGGTWTSNDNMIATVTNEGVVEGVGVGTVELTFKDNLTQCTNTVNFTVNAKPSASASSNSPVCEGDTIKLMSSGGITYSWSGPNGFSSTNQNPTITNVTTNHAGNYVVVVTNAGDCTDSKTVSVTVIEKPTVDAGNTLAAICQGATSAAMGGSVGGSATGGTWTGGGGIWSNQADPAKATYTASVSESGEIILTLTTSGGICGTASDWKKIIVNPSIKPSVSIDITAGNSTMCNGNAITITATKTNGGTSPGYQWKKNGTNIGMDSSTYTGTAGTDFINNDKITCELTSNAECASPTKDTSNEITLVVNPDHTIDMVEDREVCLNTTMKSIELNLGGGANGIEKVTDLLPDGVNGTLSGNKYIISGTPNQSGTFNYTITTKGNNCSKATATGKITVHPLPEATFSESFNICKDKQQENPPNSFISVNFSEGSKPFILNYFNAYQNSETEETINATLKSIEIDPKVVGNYNFIFKKIQDYNGCMTEYNPPIKRTINILGLPTADFKNDNLGGKIYAKNIAFFKDSSSKSVNLSNISSWFWTFQDATPDTSIEKNQNVTFVSSGLKDVKLRVKDDNNCFNEISKKVSVLNSDCDAEFSNFSPTPYCLPENGSVEISFKVRIGKSYSASTKLTWEALKSNTAWVSKDTILEIDTTKQFTIKILKEGVYKIIFNINDPNNTKCQNIIFESPEITVHKKPKVEKLSFDKSKPLCAGDTAKVELQLSGKAPFNFTSTLNAVGLKLFQNDTSFLVPSNANDSKLNYFIANLKDDNGCVAEILPPTTQNAKDSILVNPNPEFVLDKYCSPDKNLFSINFDITKGLTPFSFLSDNIKGKIDSIMFIGDTLTSQTNGTAFYIKIKDANGCIKTVNDTINCLKECNITPSEIISNNSKEYCEGENLDLATVNSPSNYINYFMTTSNTIKSVQSLKSSIIIAQWIKGNLLSWDSISNKIKTDSNYYVYAVFTNTEIKEGSKLVNLNDGCGKISNSKKIIYNSLPQPKFSLINNPVCSGDTIRLKFEKLLNTTNNSFKYTGLTIDNNVNYEKDTIQVGSIISLGKLDTGSYYKIIRGLKNNSTQCEQIVVDSVSIKINPLPTIATLDTTPCKAKEYRFEIKRDSLDKSISWKQSGNAQIMNNDTIILKESQNSLIVTIEKTNKAGCKVSRSFNILPKEKPNPDILIKDCLPLYQVANKVNGTIEKDGFSILNIKLDTTNVNLSNKSILKDNNLIFAPKVDSISVTISNGSCPGDTTIKYNTKSNASLDSVSIINCGGRLSFIAPDGVGNCYYFGRYDKLKNEMEYPFYQDSTKKDSTLVFIDNVDTARYIYFVRTFNCEKLSECGKVILSRSNEIENCKQEAEDEIRLYPNPNTGKFQIKIKGSEIGIYEIAVIDMLGRNIHKQKIHKQNEEHLEWIELGDTLMSQLLHVVISAPNGAKTLMKVVILNQ